MLHCANNLAIWVKLGRKWQETTLFPEMAIYNVCISTTHHDDKATVAVKLVDC
jgi:hypothetical protein